MLFLYVFLFCLIHPPVNDVSSKWLVSLSILITSDLKSQILDLWDEFLSQGPAQGGALLRRDVIQKFSSSGESKSFGF